MVVRGSAGGGRGGWEMGVLQGWEVGEIGGNYAAMLNIFAIEKT